jgi:hypothetical protein
VNLKKMIVIYLREKDSENVNFSASKQIHSEFFFFSKRVGKVV